MSKARRIAAHVHRGQLFHGDGLFVDHLDRVARILDAAGASWAVRQAGWLYAVGLPSLDLYRAGVPAAVVRTVEALRQRPDEFPAAFADRLRRSAEAALVRYAVLNDLHDRFAGGHPYEWQREQHVRLADALGRAAPASPRRADPEAPVTRPGPDDHLGPYARYLSAHLDTAGLMAMLDAERAGQARRCCLAAVCGEIHALADRPDSTALEPVRRMSEEWWDSPDDWKCTIAVMARAPGDRRLLLSKVDTARPTVARAAIENLTGPGDAEEIAVLERVVRDPDPRLRQSRRAAAARLATIGGPAASAALAARFLSPLDPPWRDDPTWLDVQGPGIVDVLIGTLADPQWWHEGPYALGHLRAVAAVPALCALARSANAQVPAVDALGRIGSTDAVPTLVGLGDHARPLVRDHALRALARIGGPAVVDAAVRACDDPDPVVRDRAARVLARHGDERAVTHLVRLCDTAHVGRAVAALARIGDPRALPTLWHVFRTTTDRRTRDAAGRGIAAIDGPRQHVMLFTAPVRLRRAYIWLLGHKPDWRPHDVLRRALSDDDPVVRANAATALGRLAAADPTADPAADPAAGPAERPGGPTDADRVRALLDDPDPRVRAHARFATRPRG